jgi:hypothetical protein
VNTAMNFRVPLNAGFFLSSYTTGVFSRRAIYIYIYIYMCVCVCVCVRALSVIGTVT